MEGGEGKKARTARWPTVARQQQLTPQLQVFLSKICWKTSPLSSLYAGGLRGGGQINLGLNQTFGRISADPGPAIILLVPLVSVGVGGGGEPSFWMVFKRDPAENGLTGEKKLGRIHFDLRFLHRSFKNDFRIPH